VASLKIFGSEASNSNDARCDKTGKAESMVVNDPDPFMFFEGASPTAIEVPVLRVFDGDGFLTNWQKRTNPWIMPINE
jgi:hypothetical protein